MLVGISPTANAANASLSGTNSATYTEGAAAIAPFTSVTLGGGPFDGSYVDFEVVDANGNSITGGADTDANDDLGLTSVETPVTTSNVVSVVNGVVYIGRVSTAEAIGQVDGTLNGQDGKKLRVNFSTSFQNAGFESNAISPWTVIASRIDMGTTEILGYATPADSTIEYPTQCNSEGLNDNDAPNAGASYNAQISSTEKNSGNYSLQLYSSLDTKFGGDVVHGPAAYSVEFDGTQGQSLSFYWQAKNGGDNFHVWAGLLATDASLPAGGERWTELLDPNTGSGTTWAKASGSLPHTGKFRFVFISGTHDFSCGTVAGASLYIDDVTITGSSATASAVQQLAPLVRYSSTDDSPPASRYLKMTAVPTTGTSASTTSTISVTSVNDAPSIDGDGSTTAVAKTVTETDVSSIASPLANVTGTLVGYDPDMNSPTYSFGISGETASGGTVSKVGTYGTLTINTTSGAYTYVPNMSAIKPLNDSDNPIDSFNLTVSDGALSGAGTLNFTIDGITDTEPSAPTITSVIGGDGFLTVLYTQPTVLNQITNYEYSTDGNNFRALNPPVTSGPIQINALSTNGTMALANGTSYPITIRAVNSGGNSDASNSVSGTPSNTPSVNTPVIQSFDPSTALTAISNDFQVSGFGPTDNLLVTIGLTGQSSGTQFALPNFTSSGVQAGSGFTYTNGTAVSELAITGTQSKVNAALRGLQITTGTDRSNFEVNVSASVVSGNVVQSGATQHFYEYVASSGITWEQAKTAAAARTYAGVNGYLVTITSAAENNFVKERISGATNVWIAASDSAQEGTWRWVTGPEGQNSGTVFWKTYRDANNQVVRETVTYASWAGNEPNDSDNSRGGEDHVVTNWDGTAGAWNDLNALNTGDIDGYVVEYSEWNGQTFLATSVVKTKSSVSMGGPVLTATAGQESVILSWTTPTRTGKTVTSYTVTSTPTVDNLNTICPGATTACTVTGLTAGTSYNFVVTANWSDSVTSVSNSASARALEVTVSSGGGTGGGTGGAPAATPTTTPSPTPTRTTSPIVRNTPLLSGPVNTGTNVNQLGNTPQTLIGGVPTNTTTRVVDQSKLNVLAGALNLEIQVPQNVGSVTNNGGTTQLQVQKGGVTTINGSGLRPLSTVQVFLPLGGNNSRELARIPVTSSGTFNGLATFANPTQGAPLPIGPQVLQIVSVDPAGRQAVVEMKVNIAQPAPTPEQNRANGQLPELTPGQSIATEAGLPVPVTVEAIEQQRQAIIQGDTWQMSINVPDANGEVTKTDGGALLKFIQNESVFVEGDGFLPGTRADVWLFSDPTLLGTVEIDENGKFSGQIAVDGKFVPTGEHTLQVQGVGDDGFVRSANLGVIVEANPVSATSGITSIWIYALVAVGLGATWWFFLIARRRRKEAKHS